MFSWSMMRNSGADSCNQFLEELYRVRGELLDKAMSSDPRDPGVDCTPVLQIPVAYSNGAVACFYLLHWNRTCWTRQEPLAYDDIDDEDPRLTAIKFCYKATIPIARLRELVDEDDISDNLSYRCPKCSKCQECRHSNKYRAMSVQKRREVKYLVE